MSEYTQAVLSTALALAEAGYYVLPLEPRSKACVAKDWVKARLNPSDVPAHFSDLKEFNIGILTGTSRVQGVYVTAVDIDFIDDPLVCERTRLAFPVDPPGKKGQKGITYFCREDTPNKKVKKLRKTDVGAKPEGVEFLAKGQQTVVPPSIHPAGMTYEWVGQPLVEVKPIDLPVLTATMRSEIIMAVEHPESKIFLLNTMRSADGKGGGNIHDSVLAATAALVRAQWSDEAIWERVSLATRRAIDASGLDYENSAYSQSGWEKTVRKMISDARDNKFDTPIKREKLDVIVARWMVDEWKGKGNVYNNRGLVAYYKDGYFESVQMADMRHTIVKECTHSAVSISHHDLLMAVNTILDIAPRFGKPTHRRVALLNGTFDMDAGELNNWSPDDWLISGLNFEYDEDATCPTFDRVVRETLATENEDDLDKAVATYEEFVAHTLFECMRYHKFLMLYGAPRSGKSTLAGVVKLLHNPKAVSTVSMNEMANERYRTRMAGMLVNIVSEVDAVSRIADSLIKNITSGEEIEIRYLYREPEMVVIPARIIVTCNDMPRTTDTSGAIEERQIILPCNNVVPEEARDVNLMDKIRAELPGIFNRMVQAWPRLRDRGRFDPPSSSLEYNKKYTEENNHVLQWLTESTLQGQLLVNPEFKLPDSLKPTSSAELYMNFSDWAKSNGFQNMSSVTWANKLNQIKALDLKPKNLRVGDRVIKARSLNLNTRGTGF